MTLGTDLTFLVAVAAGSDQLPVAVRPAARPGLPRPADRGRRRRVADRRTGPSRWVARPACGRLRARLRGRVHDPRRSARPTPAARSVSGSRCCARSAGSLLIVIGLNLAGLPPHRTTPADVAPARPRGQHGRRRGQRRAWSSRIRAGARPSRADRLGGRLVGDGTRARRVVRARDDLRDRLDAVHRDHPGRDPDPRGDLRLDRSRAPILLFGYTLGLGIPFLAIGAGLRPRAGGPAAAPAPRPRDVGHRRAARRRDRRRDAVRPPVADAALLPVPDRRSDGDPSGPSSSTAPSGTG